MALDPDSNIERERRRWIERDLYEGFRREINANGPNIEERETKF